MSGTDDATGVEHQRPNVVVILADDMGFADLGCYGSEIRTPNLDALAENGLRYTHMYNSARCCPSRAALLTGVHPHQAGIGHMTGQIGTTAAYQGYLRDDCTTIAEVVGAAGYRTIMSGKWHIGGGWLGRNITEPDEGHPTPLQRGFDEFYGTLDGAGSYFRPPTLMADRKMTAIDDPDYYYTDAISDHAAREVGRSVDDGQPFFAYVAYTAPHWPLHAMEEDIARYETAYRSGWDVVRTARHEQQKALGVIDPSWAISPRDSQAWAFEETMYPDWEAFRMSVYAAQIDRMDQGIGRIVESLRARDALDNTMIVFVVDNGGCAEFLAEDGVKARAGAFGGMTTGGQAVFVGNDPGRRPGGDETFMSYDIAWSNVSNAPFRRHKSWVHEGGISTPCIVHWPDSITAGELRHAPCHLIDWMPTICEMTGARYPDTRDGHDLPGPEGESLVRSFSDPDWRREAAMFFEHEGNRALRLGDWKLVNRAPYTWELYRMDEDRTELDDLAEREATRVRAMAAMWRETADRVGVLSDLEMWRAGAEGRRSLADSVKQRFAKSV